MIHFIVNPNAKSGHGKRVWALVEQTLQQREDVEYEVHKTTRVLEAMEIAKKLCAEETEGFIIVPVGGDGTLNEVICGLDLQCKDVLLGYIPTGSGNDFCRSLRMKTKPLAALERILAAEQIRTVDVGEVTCTYDTQEAAGAGGANVADGLLTELETEGVWQRTRRFGVSCGCGYDADICHKLLTSKVKPMMNKVHLGKLCYIAVGVSLICTWKPFAMLSTYWKRYRKSWKQVAFCSMHVQPYEGGGFRFAPDAVCDDGKLDVCFATASGRWRFLWVMIASLFSCHVQLEGVSSVRTEAISLQLPKGVPAHADGESLGCPRTMSAKCLSDPLRVLV